MFLWAVSQLIFAIRDIYAVDCMPVDEAARSYVARTKSGENRSGIQLIGSSNGQISVFIEGICR